MDLPLVLIEAMLLARPVIVATATAAAELCEGSAALAVVPEAEAIAHTLAGLLDSTSARAELGARARDAALARFDPISVASAYEALYDALLA
jgi:glycosyltransferase involved in cell wall biosynthesis